MSLRTRLLLAFIVIVLGPMAALAFGLRQEMTRRLTGEYEQRLDVVRTVVAEDLSRESAAVEERLAALARAVVEDNQFRSAVAGNPAARGYLLDWAEVAMRLTGLSTLQVHDPEGRIISSGHFRNAHGRVDPLLPERLTRTGDAVVLVQAAAVDRDFLALSRAAPFRIGDRTFTLVGGTEVDQAFLQRLGRDRAIELQLRHPGGTLASAASGERVAASHANASTLPPAVRELRIPLVGAPGDSSDEAVATLVLTQPRSSLADLLRSADRWFLTTATATAVMALLLALWVSSRISRPIAALADKTAILDLDRLDVQFEAGRDEVGRLAGVLGDLTARLRASTARVREAERRATVGDLARQVNHDIKNGLIPLRNVIRHLTEVARDAPEGVGAVLAERRQTIDSSIAYLETLATNYERLSRAPARRECDVNEIATEAARGAREYTHVALTTELATHLPRVFADPVALRRVLENLIANAVDSLDGKPGRVTVSTARTERHDEAPGVRLIVADTGRGMSKEETGRIFNDFYTTKPGGTGLGLSIVRRLVMDLHGTLTVESEPGVGTRMIVQIPAAAGEDLSAARGSVASGSRTSARSRRW